MAAAFPAEDWQQSNPSGQCSEEATPAAAGPAWGLPGRQQLLQARRSLAEFGFVQCVCDPGAATAEEACPPWRGRLQGWGWSSQPAVT